MLAKLVSVSDTLLLPLDLKTSSVQNCFYLIGNAIDAVKRGGLRE
jgi:hypothetical protein